METKKKRSPRKKSNVQRKEVMLEDYILSYRNDLFFKFMLVGDDEDSRYILHSIIKAVTGIDPVECTILNPELIPQHELNKRIVMDIHVKDKQGLEYNIEMQNKGPWKAEMIRFQYYSADMLTQQLKQGQFYDELKPIHQIIFFEPYVDDDHDLINHYHTMKTNGKEVEGILQEIHYVSLRAANDVKQKKGFSEMTAFELLCYLFENGETRDILMVKERLVQAVIRKYRKMRENRDLWSFAVSREIAETRDRMIKKEMCEKATAQGETSGQCKLLEHLIEKKFTTTANNWLQSLSQKQLEMVSDSILDCDSFEELKQTVESKKLQHMN